MKIEALTGSRPWLTAGWTMLHFLWVGGVLGLAAAGGRRALRAAVPEVRYGAALLCLAAMAVAPAAIAVFLAGADELPRRPTPAIDRVADVIAVPPSAEGPAPVRPAAHAKPSALPLGWAIDPPREGWRLEGHLDAMAAGLPWLWIAGTPATFALLAAGLVGAERLRRRSRPLPDGDLADLARRLAVALGIVRPVALGVCDRLVAPILLGVVRPMILLPAAAVAGWSPDQLEMALLHELAHVRRFDNLVNLAQRVIESILFFHPAVWWASGWVRLEREHCCDRLVVARTGRARPYAELLAGLAVRGSGSRPGRAAVAMAENPVVARIRCILAPEDHLMPLSRPVVAIAAVLLIAPAVLIASQAGTRGPSSANAPTTPQAAGAPQKPDAARIEELLRRARHGADMFPDVQERAFTLTQIAGVQARLGDRDAARRTFREAEQLAEAVRFDDATYSPHILLWVVQAEERQGFRDEAIAAARTLLRLSEAPVKNNFKKIDLHVNLIRAQVDLGDRAGVQETLRAGRRFFETSKGPGFVDDVLQFVVKIQAASGDLAGALRMVREPEQFKGQTPRNSAIRRRSAIFGAVGEIRANNREGAGPVLEEALRAVADYKDPVPWGRVTVTNQYLREIASAQARIGLFHEALKTARMIDPESVTGGLADAVKAEFLDRERFNKAKTLAGIALMQVKAGDASGARRPAGEAARIAGTIHAEGYKSMPVREATEALARAGDIAGALQLAEELDAGRRIEAYENISSIRRDAGDAAGARATLEAALDLARRRVDAFPAANGEPGDADLAERDRLLASLAHLQAMTGDRERAIETIQQINDANQQMEALKGLATGLAAAGDLDAALEAAGRIGSPKSQAEVMLAVASAYSRRGAIPAARR